MLIKLVLKLFGKKLIDGGIEKIGLSRTKLIAVVGVLITAIEVLAPAFGWNIKIPPEVYTLLAGSGLWTLSDKKDSVAKTV